MKTAIVIPARYGSTRFPGKPLAEIAGKTMLQRVVETGRQAIAGRPGIDLLVATEDEKIAAHCRDIDAECVMTPADCPTGSDRVLQAVRGSGSSYDFVINFQGDTPFTPPEVLTGLLDEINSKSGKIEVITPVHRLSWAELDQMRENKKQTPFSGTTAVRNEETGQALWFSKQILPAIRNERELRDTGAPCPVLQHIGIYGYRRDVLEKFVSLPQSLYEKLEGLEQLRLLENGIRILAVEIGFAGNAAWKKLQGGIDSPEDIERAEKILAQLEKAG